MGHIENYLFNRKCVTPTKSIFLNFLAFWLFFAVTGSSAIHLPPLHLRFARLQIRFSFSSFLFFPPDKSETQISILARLVITCRQTKTRVITNHNRPDKATNQSYWSYNVTQPASSSGKQVHSSLGCDWTLIGRENAVRIFSQSYHRIENLRQRRTSFRPIENWCVQVFRSHGTKLSVWKFGRLALQSPVWTERKYWTVSCEPSVRSNFSAGRKFVRCRQKLA